MSRELTRQEKAAIRSLVKRWCANYDKDIDCLPLDCECYMLGKCWTGAYCRYGGEYDGAEDYDETDPEDDGPPWDEAGEE